MHVLVIDDEKEICDLIEIYLVEEGFKVTKRYNALTILDDIQNVDLIILDIRRLFNPKELQKIIDIN